MENKNYGYLIATDYVCADGKTDVSDGLQQLIDSSRLQLREGFDLLTAVHTYFGSLQSFLVLSGMVPGRYFNVDMEKYLNMSTEVFLNGVFEELT